MALTPPSGQTPTASRSDHELARRLARETGELLVGLRAQLVASGADSAELKAEGDRQAHELLMDRLAEFAPTDAVMSEEGKAQRGRSGTSRLTAERVWIVDPLDGTREFGEPPREDWAVHVALVIAEIPVAGAIALPAQGVVLATDPAPAPRQDPPPKPRVVVSRSRPPAIALQVAEGLRGVTLEMGSAGAKIAAVISGEADAYVHGGGQFEWDSAAPVAVALAAGLHASRLDGSPLRYNQPDPYLPDLLVCHQSLAEQALALIAQA